jgi:hypothetical protein
MEPVYWSEISENFYQDTTFKQIVLLTVTATRTSNLKIFNKCRLQNEIEALNKNNYHMSSS